jgi:transposase-like protein
MQNVTMNARRSNLIEAVQYFSDLRVCNDYMVKIKWNGRKPSCPRCQSGQVCELPSRTVLKCYVCKKQFSYKVGTIFEDSAIGLDKWFVAVWSIVNAKNRISRCELARALGVTQKTAWFMVHRVRLVMRSCGFTNSPAQSNRMRHSWAAKPGTCSRQSTSGGFEVVAQAASEPSMG